MTTPETRLVYHVAASLDGFTATEDSSLALRLTAIRQMGDRMVELRFEVRKPRA
jgi:hypothetical protein